MILVVEDDAIEAMDIYKTLESWGYEVPEIIVSGEEVLEKVVDLKPDLILMDVTLKGDISGVEAGRQIKEKYDIPLIFLTAHSDEETMQNARMAGASSYVIKPFNAFELKNAIEIALYKNKLDKKLKESEKKFQLLFERTPLPYQSLDVNGHVLDVNQVWLETLGYKREEVVGKWFGDFLVSEYVDHFKKNFPKFKAEGEIHGVKFQMKHKNGSNIFAEFDGKIGFDELGHFQQTHCVFQNITDQIKAEKALKESEESYKGLFNSVKEAIYIQAEDGTFVDVNDETVKLYGYSREDLIGKTPELIAAPGRNDMAKVSDHLKKAFEGHRQTFHFWAQSKEGKIFVKNVTLSRGSYFGRDVVIAVSTDITALKKVKESLKESENYYRTIFENTGTATIIIDDDTTISRANSEFEKLSGYSKEEIEGKKKWPEFVVEEDILLMKKQHELRRIDPEAAFKSYNFKFIDRNDIIKNIHVEVDMFPGTTKSIASLLDITQQKKDEESLKQSEERLKLTLESVNDGIWDWNISTGKAVFSPSYYTMLGYEPYEFPQNFDSWRKLVHPEDIAIVDGKIKKHISEGEGYSIEMRMKTKSLKWRWILARGKVVEWDDKGDPIRMVGTHTDVTERKEMEDALRKSEERFKALIYNSSDIIRIFDENGLITFDSPSSERILGYSSETLLGKSPLEFIHPDDREIVKNDLREVYENRNPGIPTEFRIRKANGEYLPVESVSQNLFDVPGIEGIVATTHPIKNRKEMEDALRESEEKYRTLFESDPDYTLLLDLDGVIRDVNRSVIAFSGLSKDQIVGKHLDEMDFISKRELDQHLKKIDLVAQGQQILPFEIKVFNKNSSAAFIEIYVAPILKGTEIIYILLIGRDITEQRKASEEIKASLKEKELLLQEIHHRVKNNMQIISSLLSLQSQYLDDEVALDVLKESQNRVKSMALVHEKLYQSDDLTRINISNYIENLVFDLFYSYGVDRTRVRPFIDVEDIKLNIETVVPIGLIISELVSNALKHAFPQGKKGKLKIDLNDLTDEIELIIEDNGVGLPDDLDLNSTDSLGMGLVNSLVRQLDASIELQSNHGTKLIIRFEESCYKKRI